MKQFLFIVSILWFTLRIQSEQLPSVFGKNLDRIDSLQNSEISDSPSIQEFLTYVGPTIEPMFEDLFLINTIAHGNNVEHKHLDSLCTLIKAGRTTTSIKFIKTALEEAALCLMLSSGLSEDAIKEYADNIERYYNHLDICDSTEILDSSDDIYTTPDKELMTRGGDGRIIGNLTIFGNKNVRQHIDTLGNIITRGNANVFGNTVVDGNETLLGNLQVFNNKTIGGNLTIAGLTDSNESSAFQGGLTLIGKPQQACIIFQDSNLNEKARICSSPVIGTQGLLVSVDGGGTQTLQIDTNGNAAIQPLASNTASALTVNGNTSAPAVQVIGNGAEPTLRLIGNPPSSNSEPLLGLDNLGNVGPFDSLTPSNIIINGGQSGPVTIGTTDSTSLSFITNNATRLTFDTVGNATFSGNIKLPTATPNVNTSNASRLTNGLIELGGSNPSTNNVSLFEIGARNVFMGNYATTPNPSGNDNLAIGAQALQLISSGASNVAIGAFANATVTTGNFAIAIGNSTVATGNGCIGIGNLTKTTPSHAGLAIGARLNIIKTGCIAIGSANGSVTGASAVTGNFATAIGGAAGTIVGANANGLDTVSIGAGSAAGSNDSIAIGTQANATNGSNSAQNVAIGRGSQATGITQVLAIGASPLGASAGATASGARSIAIGSAIGTSLGAQSQGTGSIAIGSTITTTIAGPTATAATSTCIGSGSGSENGPTCTGNPFAIAIGTASTTNNNDSIVIGHGASGTTSLVIAIGSKDSSSTGAGPIAGTTNSNAMAIGSASGILAGPRASGSSSLAFGPADKTASYQGAVAAGLRSIALGSGASVSQADAIILGKNNNPVLAIGIGTNTPSALLHIVGQAGTPVAEFDAGSTAATSQISFRNVTAGSTAAILNLTSITNGTLKVVGSSRRFKKNFRPIDAWSSKLYQMNPCIFDYKQENGGDKDHAGFIAEEVAELFPSLVNYDADGKPFSNRDSCFHALAVREIQRHQKILNVVTYQKQCNQKKLINLLQEIERLETMITKLLKNKENI